MATQPMVTITLCYFCHSLNITELEDVLIGLKSLAIGARRVSVTSGESRLSDAFMRGQSIVERPGLSNDGAMRIERRAVSICR